MPPMTHARPAIIIVSDDDRRRTRIRHSLERWFSNDFRIVEVDDPTRIMDVITDLGQTDVDVALVIAEQGMGSETGTAVLGRIRETLPTARRAVLVGWEGGWDAAVIARASVLGDIDSVVGWPWNVSDEQFLATIGELLADWSTEHGRYVESSRLLADPDDPGARLLRDAVVRWAVPLGVYDTRSTTGQELARGLPAGGELPAVFLPDGRVLSRPSLGDIAQAFGANADLGDVFDVAIVGSGPAGLAAAVYGVSEGLETLMIEASALGGQASASPQIRNYLGFPAGISGSELMTRGLRQAWVFGARMQIGRSAVRLIDDGDAYVIELDDGSQARARAVVLAMGVTYRKLGIPSVENLFGRGVFYGAGTTEAPGVEGDEVFVVGGGNSAGQAAINLARYARKVTILIRGGSLDDMSEYLIEQLRDRPNIQILLNSEIREARGDGRLRSLVLHDRLGGGEVEEDAGALFILIGATPRTDWLPAGIDRDSGGFILTGQDVRSASRAPSQTLETSIQGIYAAGDVRHGSVKRVAAAVGEGASAIREIHGYLAARRTVSLASTRT